MIAPAVTKYRIFWDAAIVVTVIIAIYSTIFSLTHGIYEVYPFLYFLPIILFVNFYPNRGVLFSLAISTIFLVLVYFFGNFNPNLVAVSTGWFVIFVTIGFVTSSFAEGLKAEERKYREIFEHSQAGIFTFNLLTLRIQAINGKCAQMLGYDRQDLIDKELNSIFPDSARRDMFVSQIQKTPEIGDIELLLHTKDGVVRQFLVSASLSPGDMVICSAIDITERKLAERVIQKAREDLEKKVKERSEELMRANDGLKAEIQERKRFEATLQLANRKLSTLSSITRHDILNQITAIGMYLSLAEEMVTDPALLEHLKKIEQTSQMIQKQIQFARDYQDIGVNVPQWQNVAITISNAIAGFDLGGIRVEKDLGNLEIFADLLLEKVFFNLVDNVVRHGKSATVIRFSAQETGEGVTIFCKDDGVGVPESVKEGIFKREYYRNTGYGLYLAAEILSITGLSIGETGEAGTGAQFEIRVPKDAYGFGEDTK
ncbi:MAG: PAS domain-containing sensor histidine kinase [Methanoregula sp.]|jgi:PAS domain S-box-containing protein|nr:PAS domain-containing sensor histidine kinase [Methanoregula sp.]